MGSYLYFPCTLESKDILCKRKNFFRLDSNLIVKISDFGLTRNIEQKNYYKTDDQTKKFPVRWMSIETMIRGIFSLQSDVVNLLLLSTFLTSSIQFLNETTVRPPVGTPPLYISTPKTHPTPILL